MNTRELQELTTIFNDKAFAMKTKKKVLDYYINNIFWSFSPSYSLSPYEIECNGFSPDKKFLTEPVSKANIIEYGLKDEKLVYIINYGPKGTPNSIKCYAHNNNEINYYLFVKGYSNIPETLTTVGIIFYNKKGLPTEELSYFQDYFDETDEEDSPSSYDIIKKTFHYDNLNKVNKIMVRGHIEKHTRTIVRDVDYIVLYDNKGKLDSIIGIQNNMNKREAQVFP